MYDLMADNDANKATVARAGATPLLVDFPTVQ
jgi:hypothetical protein